MEHKKFLFWAVVLILGLSSLANGYTILCKWNYFIVLE